MAVIEEIEPLSKNCADLFKELLRVYPVAEVEDYYKGGMWKDELIKIDLQLLITHRGEAGAPDPIPLEEVKMPQLPAVSVLSGMTAKPAGAISLSLQKPAFAVTAAGTALAGSLITTAAGTTSNPIAELRLIALFVAKWKLDPTKTKLAIAKLPTERRKYVITNFKTVAGADGTTPEVNQTLETYIAECAANNVWDTPGETAPAAANGATKTTPLIPVSIKRPAITPVAALQVGAASDASKRPRISIGGVGAGAAVAFTPAAIAARLAAAKANPRPVLAVGAVRPGSVVIRPVMIPAAIRGSIAIKTPANFKPANTW